MIVPLPGVTVRPPEEAELLQVAIDAAAKGMFLITDGRETLVSPVVMPGWRRLAVRLKDAA
jgi:hypothetical protein